MQKKFYKNISTCKVHQQDIKAIEFLPGKIVAMATEEYLDCVRKWLNKDLSNEDLYECGKICEALEKCNQEVGETSVEFTDNVKTNCFILRKLISLVGLKRINSLG